MGAEDCMGAIVRRMQESGLRRFQVDGRYRLEDVIHNAWSQPRGEFSGASAQDFHAPDFRDRLPAKPMSHDTSCARNSVPR